MASRTEANYSCPICHKTFNNPVILSCSHSLCKACWTLRWIQRPNHDCPVCMTSCLQRDPPQNLALKNLCEAFLAERAQRASGGAGSLCNLHGETLRLFCLDDQQPVCAICLHSEIHTKHRIRTIAEAARDYKSGLRYSLDTLRKKVDLFNTKFDQAEKNIEVQAKDTERQIKDVFSKLQQFLQKEEKVRIDKVMQEKRLHIDKLSLSKTTSNTQVAALSATIRATEEALLAEDLRFLQNYKTTTQRVNQPVPYITEPIAPLLNTATHLNNLTSAVLDKMKKEMVTKN